MGLIFAKFATSLKSPKTDTAKNKPFYTSSLRFLEIAKIGLSENLSHIPNVIFAKISRREKFPIYGMAMNFEPRECVIFVQSTKIGTNENNGIHSIL